MIEYPLTLPLADLENAASGASGACGHFDGNHTILRIFEPNILNFLLRTEKGELKMKNWGWMKDILGRRMQNWGFRLQNWWWRAMNWGYALKIWRFDHATPTFDTHISVHPLSRITLFWGHCTGLNFPLEDDSQLFPGLLVTTFFFF